MSEYRITAGFIPLTDSLLLVIAREKGFAAAEGVDLMLVRETSWANIRDRVAVGHFDVAHMLAPMPIAACLGLNPIDAPVVALMSLGLGGNAVTVSKRLWAAMAEAGAPPDFRAREVGAALAEVVQADRPRLRLGVVHPYSSHNYELRYWLAASGIHPDRDVEIVVLPPPLMADALKAGHVDGYCVGEPWNSVGVANGAGRIATVKAAIWSASPEKVLGATGKWAAAHPEALAALLRALHEAALWCGHAANHAEAAAILSHPDYLDQPAALIARALSGRIEAESGVTNVIEDFFIPEKDEANLPNPRYALWFYSQMVRWGDVQHSPENATVAAACYRPDIYRAAVPGKASTRISAFFDGRPFDPERLDAYIASQS
jgi:ABC-type nitrate/sulfonate/bicarbonate transport system substrate-binding protein